MIELQAVSKSFGATLAVDRVSLRIDAGAFCVLVGPSGCGKSTLLRMINGMIAPDLGLIEVRGKNIKDVDPIALRRGIGYVIQSVGLFPHWTVEANIATVPQLLGWGREKTAKRVESVAAAMHIERGLLQRYPSQLSGGQQQRIGVARALAADPDIILMDEPFAALDPISRGNLQDEVRRLHKQAGKTFVFVTHDVNEALRLASMMVIMEKGRVVAAGAPRDILLRSEDDFVRGFLAGDELSLRLLDLTTVGDRARPGLPAEIAISVNVAATLRQALNLMLEHRCAQLRVENDADEVIGAIGVDDIVGGDGPN